MMIFHDERSVCCLLDNNLSIIRDAINEALEFHRSKELLMQKNSLRSSYGGSASDRLTAMMGFVGNTLTTVGFKLIGSNTNNKSEGLSRASAMVILCDPHTFVPVTAVSSTHLSLVRTAFTALLGIEHFCPDARTVRIFGNGDVANMLVKLLNGTNLALTVHTTTREEFQKLSTSGCLSEDVFVTATTAGKPFLNLEHTSKTKLLINLGLREVYPTAMLGFDHIVCDDLESCRKQDTPFGKAIRSGEILTERVQEFSTLYPFTHIPQAQRVYFQPSGMVAIDLLLASKVAAALK